MSSAKWRPFSLGLSELNLQMLWYIISAPPNCWDMIKIHVYSPYSAIHSAWQGLRNTIFFFCTSYFLSITYSIVINSIQHILTLRCIYSVCLQLNIPSRAIDKVHRSIYDCRSTGTDSGLLPDIGYYLFVLGRNCRSNGPEDLYDSIRFIISSASRYFAMGEGVHYTSLSLREREHFSRMLFMRLCSLSMVVADDLAPIWRTFATAMLT